MRGPSPEDRVGVELELGGLDVDRCAAIVADVIGGEVVEDSRYVRSVRTEHGVFRVELDAGWLKKLGEEVSRGRGKWRDVATDALEKLAGGVVPCEVVAPPLPRRDLPMIDALAVALGAAGGRGTYEAMRFGFGVHFNPELADVRLSTVLPVMRAFAQLHDALVDTYRVDPSRRLTGFIDPWPAALDERLLDPAYRPADLPALIDDYLRISPTRNRALDMLPLFAHVDESRVRAAVGDEKLNPRPTFHYRLCNCRIGHPDWRPSQEWGSWLRVEALARELT